MSSEAGAPARPARGNAPRRRVLTAQATTIPFRAHLGAGVEPCVRKKNFESLDPCAAACHAPRKAEADADAEADAEADADAKADEKAAAGEMPAAAFSLAH
jgi:hypothetical protein